MGLGFGLVGWLVDRVHIRCCGNGGLWFRSYSGSLLANAPKVTKRSLPHHSVPRLGSACPHSGTAPRAAATGHPWPGAAKSASLPIYPLHRACLRPSWLTGPADQNQKQIKSRAQRPTGRLECLTARSKARANADLLFCGSWLACDADTSVHQVHPVDAIAGKPAPTVHRARFSF